MSAFFHSLRFLTASAPKSASLPRPTMLVDPSGALSLQMVKPSASSSMLAYAQTDNSGAAPTAARSSP